MSTKHIFDNPEGLVDKTLRGAIAVNPALRLYKPHKVIYDSTHSNSKVAIMAGGGAGHEPGQAGLIGKGMLAAAISGDVFASPSAAQICTGIDLANTDKGVIFIINNYTGDQLHFGLAAEKARSALAISGNKTSGGVECVTVADDVAVGRAKGGLVGRRGLGMNPFSCKVLGAAAERGLSVKEIKKLGDTLIDNSVTIGTSLDHCHVPGRSKDPKEWGALPQEACEIGMGIHNEPGFKRLDKTPPPDKLIAEMLDYMLNQNDKDRAYLPFSAGDAPVLFINNLGGISQLELFAALDETIAQLGKTYDLHPARVYCNAYMTSLNAPGFGITLVKHREVTKACGVDLLDLLDDPTDAYAWTGVTRGWPSKPRDREAEEKEAEQRLAEVQKKGGAVSMLEADAKEKADGPSNADPEQTKKAIWSMCQAAIDAEPSITRHDTIVGDGDCGTGLATFAKAIQQGLDSGNVDLKVAASTVMSIGTIASDVYGGTSGAIYELFLAGLAQAFTSMPRQPATIKEWSSASSQALKSLFTFTPARPGMRTLIDALEPFVVELEKSQDLTKAVAAAKEGMEKTKRLDAKLGRSVYQGEGNEEMKQTPDPGAEGIAEVVAGLLKGLGGK